MQKFILIIILFLLSSYQIKNETDLPKGYWKIIFFSERGYLTSSHGKSLDETIEYKDSNVVLIPNITCGFYFDDFIAMDYCNIDKKRETEYWPFDDIIADFNIYFKFKQNGDTIDYLEFTGEKTLFKFSKDTLIIQGEYRTLKLIKEIDQTTPIFVEPDSVYYPRNPSKKTK